MKKIMIAGIVMTLTASLFAGQASAAVKKPTGEQIVKTAKKYLGDFDYVYGSEPWNTGYKEADCSSYTKLVFDIKHGIDLPRTSKEQSKVGKHVKKSKLKKGDLVFFDTNNDGKINHVGIYIGDGKFIHSSPINDVGINKLDSGWWEDHYVTARRVL